MPRTDLKALLISSSGIGVLTSFTAPFCARLASSVSPNTLRSFSVPPSSTLASRIGSGIVDKQLGIIQERFSD